MYIYDNAHMAEKRPSRCTPPGGPSSVYVRAGPSSVARRYERTIGTLDALIPHRSCLISCRNTVTARGPRRRRTGRGPVRARARRAGHVVYVMAHGGRVREPRGSAAGRGPQPRPLSTVPNRGRCLSCHSPPHNNTIDYKRADSSTYGVRGYGIRKDHLSVALCCVVTVPTRRQDNLDGPDAG